MIGGYVDIPRLVVVAGNNDACVGTSAMLAEELFRISTSSSATSAWAQQPDLDEAKAWCWYDGRRWQGPLHRQPRIPDAAPPEYQTRTPVSKERNPIRRREE